MVYLALDVFYVMLLAVASPWVLFRALFRGKYREGLRQKLFGAVPRRAPERTCLWFHAVSVGEVNLLTPLLSQLRKRRPDWQCVLSTTTMTGMQLAREKHPELSVFYCPLDFSWAVRRAMRRVAPDALFLVELELWPNLIRAAKEHGAQVALVNARLSENSFRGYRRIRSVTRCILRQVDLLAVQSETYAGRFHALGARPSTIQVTGSMKFDGAVTDRNNPRTKALRNLAGFSGDDVVFLAGSTQAPEESFALAAYLQLRKQWPSLRLVVVPRHPERFDAVGRLIAESGVPLLRRSELSDGQALPREAVLLVDTVGELGAWWGTADIAYVGGSMGNRGGQNMIEPAAFGASVAFGPNTRNFRDVVQSLLQRDAAVVVEDQGALSQFVRHCLEQPQACRERGERAREVVQENLGATERTLELVERLLARRSRGVSRRAA